MSKALYVLGKIGKVSSLHQLSWRFLLALLAIRTCYMQFTLVEVILVPEKIFIHHFPIHLVYTMACTLSTCFLFFTFVKEPQVTEIIFNCLFTENLGENSTRRTFLQYSYQELLAKFLPIMLSPIIFVITFIFYTEPNMAFLLHRGLPEEYQSHVVLFISIFLDFLTTTFVNVSMYFWLEFSLLFFERMFASLQKILRCTSTNIAVEDKCEELHKVVLLLRLFNVHSAPCVFALKQVCLILATVDTCKNQLLVELNRRRPIHAKVMERRLWALPKIGVEVGGFRKLEPTSTPEFLDFVASNAASLLIMSR
ncbi:unnamed protein product [Allacma fusca]|uniref:Uncharacterized protein n=1 Tax=Allacma fusca TaxID=39272 RepID=A0A8J2Q1Z9_9HEXA|nr:unnamed protein product [Allacma fusca]